MQLQCVSRWNVYVLQKMIHGPSTLKIKIPHSCLPHAPSTSLMITSHDLLKLFKFMLKHLNPRGFAPLILQTKSKTTKQWTTAVTTQWRFGRSCVVMLWLVTVTAHSSVRISSDPGCEVHNRYMETLNIDLSCSCPCINLLAMDFFSNFSTPCI